MDRIEAFGAPGSFGNWFDLGLSSYWFRRHRERARDLRSYVDVSARRGASLWAFAQQNSRVFETEDILNCFFESQREAHIAELLPRAETEGVASKPHARIMGLVRVRGSELGRTNFAKLDLAAGADSKMSLRLGRDPSIYPFLACA